MTIPPSINFLFSGSFPSLYSSPWSKFRRRMGKLRGREGGRLVLSGIQQLVVGKERSGQNQWLPGMTCQESLGATDLWGRALGDRHLPAPSEGLTTMNSIQHNSVVFTTWILHFHWDQMTKCTSLDILQTGRAMSQEITWALNQGDQKKISLGLVSLIIK